MTSPRSVAVLYRIARLAHNALGDDEPAGPVTVSDEDAAALWEMLRDLDGAEPAWLDRTPHAVSSNERKGGRSPEATSRRQAKRVAKLAARQGRPVDDRDE